MKHIYIKQLLAAALIACGTAASAQDFMADGIYYYIEEGDKQECRVAPGDKDYEGMVSIPETVTYGEATYTVTAIGDYAFNDCTGLTGVAIPETVTEIGRNAFAGCTSLTSVTIPNSVGKIGNNAF